MPDQNPKDYTEVQINSKPVIKISSLIEGHLTLFPVSNIPKQHLFFRCGFSELFPVEAIAPNPELQQTSMEDVVIPEQWQQDPLHL